MKKNLFLLVLFLYSFACSASQIFPFNTSTEFSLNEAAGFINNLTNDLEENYKIRIDLRDVVDRAFALVPSIPNISTEEVQLAEEYYSLLLAQCGYRQSGFFWNKKNNEEINLPPKLASSFVMLLAGSIFCVIPTGITQTIGVGMIFAGLGYAVDGIHSGEKITFFDPETGKRRDFSVLK